MKKKVFNVFTILCGILAGAYTAAVIMQKKTRYICPNSNHLFDDEMYY